MESDTRFSTSVFFISHLPPGLWVSHCDHFWILLKLLEIWTWIWIYLQIFVKIWNVPNEILRGGPGDTDSWQNLKSKTSCQTPFKNRLDLPESGTWPWRRERPRRGQRSERGGCPLPPKQLRAKIIRGTVRPRFIPKCMAFRRNQSHRDIPGT